MRRSSGIIRLALLLSLGALSACSIFSPWQPPYYTVRSGDTLYAIAWKHGLDYRELARWNGISDPARIMPGQRLRLTAPAGGRAANKPQPKVASAGSPPARSAPAAPAPKVDRVQSLPWRWPANGRVVARFGDPASIGKGIDIGGAVDDPVFAAADGKVVYTGSGLIGYGKLIIIKHNNTYLSAYGHNRTLLVSQGDAVVAGQQVARIGEGPEQRAVLHFEIRLDGKPVDPLQYLPKR